MHATHCNRFSEKLSTSLLLNYSMPNPHVIREPAKTGETDAIKISNFGKCKTADICHLENYKIGHVSVTI